MRIAISNLAWEIRDDERVFKLLHELDLSAIEIAPTKYFPDLTKVTQQDAVDLKSKLANAGIDVVSFQALLYGKPELTIFGDADTRKRTTDYLVGVGRLAHWIGAKKLIFGSPRNRRVPDGMDADASLAMAVDFFRNIASEYRSLGVTMCMEPNAAEYNCNFCVRADETAGLVRAVNDPGFRLHLDSGVMAMNDEDPAKVVQSHSDIIDHVHASEPRLAQVGHDKKTSHRVLAQALFDKGYGGFVSIEMLPPPDGIEGIEQTLKFVMKTYGHVGA